MSFTPSQLSKSTLTTTGVDIKKAQSKFEDGGAAFVMGNFKANGKSFKLKLVASVTSNGITENKWTNNGKDSVTHSLGIKLEDDELEGVTELETFLATLIPDNFEITTVIKNNEILYPKVKDKKTFEALSNIKALQVVSGTECDILANLKFYRSFKDEKAGLVIQPVKYVFVS